MPIKSIPEYEFQRDKNQVHAQNILPHVKYWFPFSSVYLIYETFDQNIAELQHICKQMQTWLNQTNPFIVNPK